MVSKETLIQYIKENCIWNLDVAQLCDDEDGYMLGYNHWRDNSDDVEIVEGATFTEAQKVDILSKDIDKVIARWQRVINFDDYTEDQQKKLVRLGVLYRHELMNTSEILRYVYDGNMEGWVARFPEHPLAYPQALHEATLDPTMEQAMVNELEVYRGIFEE